MGYRIRYGFRRRGADTIYKQLFGSLLLLVLTGMGLILGQRTTLGTVLAAGPVTLTERAVTSMARSLAAGEGWYHALAVWCRTILDAAV